MAKRSKKQKERPASFPVKTIGAPAPSWWQRDWFWGLLLIAAVILAYQPVGHAGFIWDDDAYITNNLLLHSFHGLWQIWFVPGSTEQFYPLTNTSFWIEYHLWQLNPLGYHLVNVLLHTGNALLLWLLLRRLGVKGAWLAAALFALHPVCVESVAWVTERKNTLSGFFYLSSLLAAVAFWKLESATTDPRRQTEGPKQWRFFWLAFFLYLAALASKTATVPLPIVIFLLLWWKRPKWEYRDLSPLLPFLLLGLVMGGFTMWVEKHYVGTTGTDWGFSLPERCIIIGNNLWFYLGKLIWPHPLIFIYPRWNIDAAQPLMYLPFLAFLGGLFFLWWNRQGRLRPIFLAMAYFVILLFPACGTFNQYFFRYSFVSDHLQYLACIGPLTLAAVGIASGFDSLKQGNPFLKSAVCGMLLLTLGVLTWRQCLMYSNIETLFRTTIARNPQCWMAYYNLGGILMNTGRESEAIEEYGQALKIKYDNPDADYNTDMGVALMLTGHGPEAIERYERALRINPDYVVAHIDLGSALSRMGRVPEAIEQDEQALRINPDYAEAHYNLGNALVRVGRTEEAIGHFQQAIRINPDYADAHNNLGDALEKTGRLSEAIDQYKQAVQLNPDDVQARDNLTRTEGGKK